MNNIKKTMYNIYRKYVMNYLTGNLGKVIEDDEKLICYVQKNKIKTENYAYVICCNGIRESDKKLAQTYNLNKPICYIIDGIESSKKWVNIYGYNNCEVIIKNCKFGFNSSIHVDGKCTIDNTVIKVIEYLLIGANELVIKNISKDQLEVLISFNTNIRIGADDKLQIINSNIDIKRKQNEIYLFSANELNIINSHIESNEITCNANRIITDTVSSLDASDKVVLKTESITPMNINSPGIILNGNVISNKRKSFCLDATTLKRIELVSALKGVKEKCQEQLNNDHISKILRK